MLRRSVGLLVVLGVVVAASGCGGAKNAGSGRLSVVTTTPVLAALVSSVTGGLVDVESIMPGGADPHGYQPSAQDRRAMLEADLLVVNGGDLEAGLLDVIDDATADGVKTLVALDAVRPLRYANGSPDPHFWHDPQRAAVFVMAVAGRLGKLDPRHAHDYQDAAANAAADLGRFGGEVESILAAVSPARRLLVTSHDAFRYFADRFGLEVVGTIIPGRSTDVAPSAARLAELAQEMRTRGICVVFANVEDSSALAESLADEVGSDVVVVSLFAATLPNGHEDLGGYERLVRENASRVAKALARCA